MKKLFLFLLVLPVLAFATTAAQKVDSSDPYKMMAQVAQTTFARMKADAELIKTQPGHLEQIVEQEMLPYVDYQYAAYKVIGQQLQKTTKPQRDRFVDAFRNYLVTSYAKAMTNYDDQTVSVEPAKTISMQDKFVTVRVLITAPDRKDIRLDFQARKLKNNDWKVYDMTAEGVSLLSTKQSELGGLIRTQGLDAVSEILEKKTLEEHAALTGEAGESTVDD